MTRGLSHSDVLRARMHVTCGCLSDAYRRLWAHPDVGRLVTEFLILHHQIVRASVPLMEAAHTVASARAEADPVSFALIPYLARHVDEERAHDEWLLEDLETAGIAPRDVLGRIPAPTVAALVGAQYYWIHHHHPAALLGYMRLLEGNPPSSAHIEMLQEKSGLPDAAFRTYRLHGELDPNHGREMDEFLDSVPLAERHGLLIWISASHTARTLAHCLADLEPVDLPSSRSESPRIRHSR